MSSAREIADGLTKAQRGVFATAEDYGSWTLIRWPDRNRPNGWRSKGLSLFWNDDYDSLTRLGLEVRSILQEKQP